MQQSSDFPMQSSANMFLITDPVLVLNLCAGMEHLVKELSLLLKLLENESVSSATAEKMSVVRNLVKQLQPSGEIEQQIHNSWAETPRWRDSHINNYSNVKVFQTAQLLWAKGLIKKMSA